MDRHLSVIQVMRDVPPRLSQFDRREVDVVCGITESSVKFVTRNPSICGTHLQVLKKRADYVMRPRLEGSKGL